MSWKENSAGQRVMQGGWSKESFLSLFACVRCVRACGRGHACLSVCVCLSVGRLIVISASLLPRTTFVQLECLCCAGGFPTQEVSHAKGEFSHAHEEEGGDAVLRFLGLFLGGRLLGRGVTFAVLKSSVFLLGRCAAVVQLTRGRVWVGCEHCCTV